MARILTAGAEEGLFIPTPFNGSVELTTRYSRFTKTGDVLDVEPKTGKHAYFLEYSYPVRHFWTSDPTESWMGFWMYVDGYPSATTLMFGFYCDTAYSVGNYLGVWSNAGNGTLTLRRDSTLLATGASLLTIGAWHHFELYCKPANSGGVITLKIDGSQVLTYSGDTTNDAQFTNGMIINNCKSGGECYIDDVVVNDNVGSYNNTWPGMVRLLPIIPRSAGDSTQFSIGGLDLGANYRQVSNMGNQSVIETATSGNKDLYFTDVPDIPAGATITNIVVQANAKIEDGSGNIKLKVKGATTEDESSSLPLTASEAIYQEAFAVNPDDSAAWEEADLADFQIGVEAA